MKYTISVPTESALGFPFAGRLLMYGITEYKYLRFIKPFAIFEVECDESTLTILRLALNAELLVEESGDEV